VDEAGRNSDLLRIVMDEAKNRGMDIKLAYKSELSQSLNRNSSLKDPYGIKSST